MDQIEILKNLIKTEMKCILTVLKHVRYKEWTTGMELIITGYI